MKIKKAHRLWLASAVTIVVLISVTGAVMRKSVVGNEDDVPTAVSLQTKSPSALRNPTASGVQSFSNLGVQEFTHTLVKGVPVSATVLVEQPAGNSNDAIKKTSGRVYRDSEGRTRHDEISETKEQDASIVEDVLKTTINDPAAGVSFIIDPKVNIARRKAFFAQKEPGSNELRNSPAQSAAAKPGRSNSQILPVPNTIDMSHGLKSANTTSSPNAKRESLGRRELEGMLADGTRIVMTVPTGSMKNEKQIEIACDRWYSPSLKALILVECSDSRSGKTTYRMTQIKTGEPSTSIFKVPADYKIYE